MPDRHALLGPSSSHRWLACTKSARLEETFPNTATAFTEEGTHAHSLAENKLRKLNGLRKKKLDFTPDVEMENCTDMYRDIVEEELNAAKAVTKDAHLFIEMEINFSEYVPEGFGTSDAVIVGDGTLEVIDFKYGKGVPVDAVGNPQLRLYALGSYLSLAELYDINHIKMMIIQPRLDSVTTDEMPLKDLLDWAENYVKPRAQLAWDGEGEFCVGEHCRFCKAGAVCRARVDEAFDVIDRSDEAPETISDDEIPGILDKLDNAEKWIDSLRAYAQERALAGMTWKGYKLVESRTLRKISNDLEALTRLQKEGYSMDEVTNLKLKGITDLEKLLGKPKFKDVLGELVVKPKGAPTLVHESDKREAINIVEDAFKEEI